MMLNANKYNHLSEIYFVKDFKLFEEHLLMTRGI